MKKHPIFSGEFSRDMWEVINSARTVEDLEIALYFVCCRLQELESRLERSIRCHGAAEHSLSRVCPICHRPDSEHSLECPPEFTPRN